MVVPDIPVIHRLLTENFTSATRIEGAWSSSDRGGRPSLSGRPETARRARKGQKNRSPPAGMDEASALFGPAGKRRRKRKFSLARRGSRVLRDLVSEAGRGSGFPKKGRGTSDGFSRDLVSGLRVERFRSRIRVLECRSQDLDLKGRPGVERQANLREAQSSRSQGSSQEGAVRWKATPELVSQDREAGNQSFRAAGTR
jgi:hypothetical protein